MAATSATSLTRLPGPALYIGHGTGGKWTVEPGGVIAGEQDHPQWAPDGRTIAFENRLERASQTEVLILDLETRVARKLAESDADQRYPVWSPDGRSVYFSSKSQDRAGVWEASLDRARQPRLIVEGDGLAPAAVHGGFLYVVERTRGNRGPLWRTRLPEARPREPLVERVYADDHALRGDSLAYVEGVAENDEGWIVLLDLPTRRRMRLVSAGPYEMGQGSGLSISPDGQWIIYP